MEVYSEVIIHVAYKIPSHYKREIADQARREQKSTGKRVYPAHVLQRILAKEFPETAKIVASQSREKSA